MCTRAAVIAPSPRHEPAPAPLRPHPPPAFPAPLPPSPPLCPARRGTRGRGALRGPLGRGQELTPAMTGLGEAEPTSPGGEGQGERADDAGEAEGGESGAGEAAEAALSPRPARAPALGPPHAAQMLESPLMLPSMPTVGSGRGAHGRVGGAIDDHWGGGAPPAAAGGGPRAVPPRAPPCSPLPRARRWSPRPPPACCPTPSPLSTPRAAGGSRARQLTAPSAACRSPMAGAASSTPGPTLATTLRPPATARCTPPHKASDGGWRRSRWAVDVSRGCGPARA